MPTTKQVTVGSVIATIAIAGGMSAYDPQVLLTDIRGSETRFESVSECNQVKNDLVIKLGQQILDADDGKILRALKKEKCSLLSDDIPEYVKKDIEQLIIGDNGMIFYNWNDMMTRHTEEALKFRK